MRRRTWVLLAAVVAVVVAAGLAVANWQGDGGASPLTLREYPIGERPVAPAIAGELLDGTDFDLADWHGEVVVVNMWGSWCPPCRAETDDLEAVYQTTQPLGVRFLGINVRDSRDKAIRFTDGRVSYPSIFDPAFKTGLAFRDPPAPIGPPATLVIDRDGDVAATVYRVIGKVELEQLVRRIAAEEISPDG